MAITIEPLRLSIWPSVERIIELKILDVQQSCRRIDFPRVILLNTEKTFTSAWGLLAPAILGLLIESYEIWMHYREIGLFAPGYDPIVIMLLRHSVDVLKMLSLPLILLIIGKIVAHPNY